MNGDRLTELAGALDAAWSRASTVPAPSRTDPGLTLEDAYAVQDRIVETRLARGARRAGWKMGLTSAAPPAVPIVGTLLADMVAPSGTDLLLSTMVAPLVEAEFVVRLGATIDHPVSIDDLARGPHEVAPGIEVIDYRTVDATGVVDWVADNATIGHAVTGAFVPVAATSPPDVEASLSCDGVPLAAGKGSSVMGNPLAAVAWLSEHLLARGLRLTEGEIVLTGSLTGNHAVPAARSSTFDADFGALGSVSVRFHP